MKLEVFYKNKEIKGYETTMGAIKEHNGELSEKRIKEWRLFCADRDNFKLVPIKHHNRIISVNIYDKYGTFVRRFDWQSLVKY